MNILKRILWITRFVTGSLLFTLFIFFSFYELKNITPTGTPQLAAIGFFVITIVLFLEIGWLIIRTRSLDPQGHERKILIRAALYLFDAITLVLGTITAFATLYTLCPVIDVDTLSGNTALYFSIVTFTTLGYGELTPAKGFELIAAGEALLGLLVFGLLIGYASSLFSDRPEKKSGERT